MGVVISVVTSSPSSALPPLLPNQVVFGRIIDGMDLVKLIESKGTSGGKTSVEISIADSGELPMEE